MPISKNQSLEEQGFIHLLMLVGVVIVLLIIAVLISSQVTTTKEFSKNGSNVKGIMLARGGDSNEDAGEENHAGSNDSNSGSGSSTNNEDAKTESEPESSSQPTVKVKTETSSNKQKTEIKFSEDDKIKTEVKDNRTRIDVYSGGVKVRYEIRDGRVIIKAETEEGEDVPENELLEIEEKLSANGIKIATEGGKMLVSRNNIGAITSFPFQIDLNTNQLIASTSAGVKILTVLPDQAVQNLLAANVISRLNAGDVASLAKLGNITSVKDIITLGERNSLPVYEINGLKEQKLLGFIPVTTSTTVFVSAETGKPVAQEQSLLTSIIDLLSPK